MLNLFIISIQVQQSLNLISIIQVATNAEFFYVQVIVPYSSKIVIYQSIIYGSLQIS